MNKYQEAKTNIVNTLVRIVGYPTYKKQFERDLEVLGKLLEKATPKKVIANGIRNGRTINTVSYTCPVCNNHIGRNYFCKHCGQALDWSNEG